jgi:hypothetical protein
MEGFGRKFPSDRGRQPVGEAGGRNQRAEVQRSETGGFNNLNEAVRPF